jgi:hypothetical protein
MILLFSALLSVVTIAWSYHSEERSGIWISIVMLSIMMTAYLIVWIEICLPAIFEQLSLPGTKVILAGLVSGIEVSISLWMMNWLLNKAVLPSSTNWFRRTKYSRSIRLFLLCTLFLTLGWLGFSIVSLLTGTLNFTPTAWFISGSLFFAGVIHHYAGRQSIFKMPVLYCAFAFTLLYPFLVHWNMTIYRLAIIRDWNIPALLLHYLALGLLIVTGKMIIRRIQRHHVKNPGLQRGLILLTIFAIVFLLCTEYDNFSMIIAAIQHKLQGEVITGTYVPTLNKYLPYSSISGGFILWIFFQAVVRRNLFLRNSSIVLGVVILIKLFAFDIPMLTPEGRIMVFVVLTVLIIGFAISYPRISKGKPLIPEIKRHH